MTMVSIKLTGRTALVCHNSQLADPDNPFVKAISEITRKKKKTEEDRKEIARLEWYGGIYATEGIPIIPLANVKKCFIEGGKLGRLGTAISRALHFHSLETPIVYDGPKVLDKLFAMPKHHLRVSVGVNQNRTMRTRPMFPKWELQFDAELIENALSFEDFVTVVQQAGRVEGLGDNRVNGYGRFDAAISKSE